MADHPKIRHSLALGPTRAPADQEAPMAVDTIVARTTPHGRGGVAIVRLSGPQSGKIATVLAGSLPAPRQAELRSFKNADDQVIDSGLLLFFRAPHSFTGEDIAEFHCHGSPVVVDMLLARAMQLGARMALPGEFSQRAFLNERIDLAQAEAIADVIDASSDQAALSAQRVLQGDFSRRLHQLAAQLTELRVYIEAALDFPDEEIDFLADQHLVKRVDDLQQAIDNIAGSAQQGQLLRDGIKAVISGPANVGKSTLLNALAGQQRAIVTDIAGTTRDLLRETLIINGLPMEIIDTAGLRESEDPVEQAGILLAQGAMQSADLLLIIEAIDGDTDQRQPLSRAMETIPRRVKQISVINKIDIAGSPPRVNRENGAVQVQLSAKTGEGLDLLRSEIEKAAGYHPGEEGVFIARRRHLDVLRRVSESVSRGRMALQRLGAGELLAEELRVSQVALGEITGEVTPDDLLGEIFSNFCIGK